MRCIALLFLPILLLAGEAAQPSGEEQLVLDLINHHRTERRPIDLEIGSIVAKGLTSAQTNVWGWAGQTFPHKGLGDPLAPLVFEPALNAAARALLAAGNKVPDGQPFDASPALRKAGYARPDRSLVMFGPESPSLLVAYARACTSSRGTYKNGEQTYPLFLARESLKSEWREVGITVKKVKTGFSVVIVLGTGEATRYLGGVVYADANRNLAYDPGEGKAGIVVTCGAATTTTGPAGTWSLALSDATPTEATFSGNGFTTIRPLAPGVATQTFVWRLPNPVEVENADRLIAAVDKAGNDHDKAKIALAALLTFSRMAALDDGRTTRIQTLVAPIQDEFSQTMSALLSALGEDQATFKRKLNGKQREWNGAMPAWFKEAEGLARLREQVNAVLAAPVEQRAKLAPVVKKLLDKALATTTDPTFLAQYKTWSGLLDEALAVVLEADLVKKQK